MAYYSSKLICLVTLTISIIVAGIIGCQSPNDESVREQDDELQRAVVTFCGACHQSPDPSSFPKSAWKKEVEQGYRFYYQSGRTDLKVPPQDKVVQWFRSQAPEKLILETQINAFSPIEFRKATIDGGDDSRAVAVSHIHLPSRQDNSLFHFCDMSRNGVFTAQFVNSRWESKLFVECSHPAHVEATDLNEDGRADYLIAVLGSYSPEDHDKGRVLWHRPELGAPGNIELLKGVGRVADVQAADIDDDGDLDLVVAEFGWRKSGSIRLLTQTGIKDTVPEFRTHRIDDRHGAIHVPIMDLDKDGDMDFIALISQEHEEVAAYLNSGNGHFERQIIYLSGNPAFGSSGIQIVDMDQDGDSDVLMSNGDTLDSTFLKPYHGVRWLENRGDFPFSAHSIALLPGVYRAVAGDLDGDGDNDIVAGAWIPHDTPTQSAEKDGLFDTLIWMEQTEAGQFSRHVLARTPHSGYMTLNLADVDQDKDLDIICGNFSATPSKSNWVDIYVNSGRFSVK